MEGITLPPTFKLRGLLEEADPEKEFREHLIPVLLTYAGRWITPEDAAHIFIDAAATHVIEQVKKMSPVEKNKKPALVLMTGGLLNAFLLQNEEMIAKATACILRVFGTQIKRTVSADEPS